MKPFAWSWSKLKNYRTCPKRHYEIDITKNYVERQSEQLKWGNLVHESLANYIDKGKKLPVAVQRYHEWPDRIIKLKNVADIQVEQQLAIAKDFGACGWFTPDAWFRAKIDVQILLPEFNSAITIDWKTGGKVEPEFEQLALSAQTIFAHYPKIDSVAALYVWLGHDTQTAKIYYRDQMAKVWNELWPMINEMDFAWRTTTYPAKPSGLCISYCPVTSCPYHGKGNR
jgi:hypothetical protein